MIFNTIAISVIILILGLTTVSITYYSTIGTIYNHCNTNGTYKFSTFDTAYSSHQYFGKTIRCKVIENE